MSTVYYCLKSESKVIGTHKDWLILRDINPEYFNSIRNSKDIELVRIGYGSSYTKATIEKYQLWDKHIELCHSYMKKEIEDLTKQIEELEEDIRYVHNYSSKNILTTELDNLNDTLTEYRLALKQGKTRLPILDRDYF